MLQNSSGRFSSAHDLGHRLRHQRDRLGRQTRHVHAAVEDEVDSVICAQLLHLLHACAKQREHAAMRSEEGETVGPGDALQLGSQSFPVCLHAFTHLAQLAPPHIRQAGIAQNGLHSPRAMVGGKGKVLPVEPGQHAARRCGGLLIPTERHGDAHAVAVEAEILGTGGRNQHLGQHCRQQAHPGGVFLDALTETQIGHVNEGDRPRGQAQPAKRAPVVKAQVHAGGVVAAAMHENQVALFHARQIFHHARTIQPAAFGVVVAVFAHSEAKVADDRRVVRPGRCADPDGGVRRQALDHLQHLPHGPGAAGGARCGQARMRYRVGKEQPLHRGQIARVARQRDISFAVLCLPDQFFRRFHGFHHRGLAPGRLVDADAQIDLPIPRILAEHLHQLDDLVGLRGGQGLEHDASPQAGNCDGSRSRVRMRV